jgi:hypothetical protein
MLVIHRGATGDPAPDSDKFPTVRITRRLAAHGGGVPPRRALEFGLITGRPRAAGGRIAATSLTQQASIHPSSAQQGKLVAHRRGRPQPTTIIASPPLARSSHARAPSRPAWPRGPSVSAANAQRTSIRCHPVRSRSAAAFRPSAGATPPMCSSAQVPARFMDRWYPIAPRSPRTASRGRLLQAHHGQRSASKKCLGSS